MLNEKMMENLGRFVNESSGNTGLACIRLAQDGKLHINGTDETVASDKQFLALIAKAIRGWRRLEANVAPVFEVGSIVSGFVTPTRKSLGETELIGENDPWKEYIGLPLIDHDGRLYRFETASFSGRSAITDLIADYYYQASKRPMGEMPVVTISVGQGKSKKYGAFPVPVFKIVTWATVAAVQALEHRADEDPAEVEADPRERDPVDNLPFFGD